MAQTKHERAASTYEKVLDAWSQGLRLADIARQVGVSAPRCQQLLAKGHRRSDWRANVVHDRRAPTTAQERRKQQRAAQAELTREAVLNCYAQRESMEEVAKELSLNPGTVSRILKASRDAGDKRAKKATTLQFRVVEAWNHGATYKEIMERFQVTNGAVGIYLARARRRGQPVRLGRTPRHNHRAILDLWNAGITSRQIAGETGLSIKAVEKVVYRLRSLGHVVARRHGHSQKQT